VAVAVAVGRDGIDNLLIISQIILSIVLPFVAFPLIYLTSSKVVMRVRKPSPSPLSPVDIKIPQERCEDSSVHATENALAAPLERSAHGSIQEVPIEDEPLHTLDDKVAQDYGIEFNPEMVSLDESEYIDYSNGPLMSISAYLIWAAILAANVYAMVALGLDET
jgi:metal iron transporter